MPMTCIPPCNTRRIEGWHKLSNVLFWFKMARQSRHWDPRRRSVAYVFLARGNVIGIRISIRGALFDDNFEARLVAACALRRHTPKRLEQIAQRMSDIDVVTLLEAVHGSGTDLDSDDQGGAGIPVRPKAPVRGPGNENEIPRPID